MLPVSIVLWICFQAGIATQVMAMLESNSADVRAVGAACLGDLAAAHPPLQPYLTQVTCTLKYQLSGHNHEPGSSLLITGT